MQIGTLYSGFHFHGCAGLHVCLYVHIQTGLIFTVGQSNTKIGPLENETHMIFAIAKFVHACEMRGGAIAHPATR